MESCFCIESTIFGKIAVSPKIMTISSDLAISNSMSSYVPKYWLNWQILVAIFNEFLGQSRLVDDDE